MKRMTKNLIGHEAFRFNAEKRWQETVSSLFMGSEYDKKGRYDKAW